MKILIAIIGCYALSYTHYFLDGDLAWYVFANDCRFIIAVYSVAAYNLANKENSTLKMFLLAMAIHWCSAFFFSLLDDLGLTDGQILGFVARQFFIFVEILLFFSFTSTMIYKTILNREKIADDKQRDSTDN